MTKWYNNKLHMEMKSKLNEPTTRLTSPPVYCSLGARTSHYHLHRHCVAQSLNTKHDIFLVEVDAAKAHSKTAQKSSGMAQLIGNA